MTDAYQKAREVLASAQARAKALEHVHHDVPQSTLDGLHNDLSNLEALIAQIEGNAPQATYRVHLDSLDDLAAVLCFPVGNAERNEALTDIRFTRAEWEALGRPGVLDVSVEAPRG